MARTIDVTTLPLAWRAKTAVTPEFVEMVDNIEKCEPTPRTEFHNLLSTLQATDWLMGQRLLSDHFIDAQRHVHDETVWRRQGPIYW